MAPLAEEICRIANSDAHPAHKLTSHDVALEKITARVMGVYGCQFHLDI